MKTESQRIYKEFQRLYALKPELDVRANDRLFLDWEGEDAFTAENAILWLDNPQFRSQLAVLREPRETLEQAISGYMKQNPALSSDANRQMILERINWSHETVQEAVSALGNQLSFNQEVADEHQQQQAMQARESLIEELVQDHSSLSWNQNIYRQKLQRYSTESLQAKAQEVRDRKFFRSMSKDELKAHLRNLREQQAPTAPQLPAEYTVERIKSLSVQEIKNLNNRYGRDVVNARLGYVKPQIQGDVRIVNMEMS
jgi:hypothetical protein